MITGELKSKIDRVWDAFWSGGISNPLEVIEQITYLLFIRRLDDIQILAEKKARVTGGAVENAAFLPGQAHLRWSQFKNTSPELMHRPSPTRSSHSCARWATAPPTVELAYATTAYGAQGSTVPVSHVLVGERTGAASAYVGMTRGRERNVAHLVAESVEDARRLWIDVFSRDRADLGPARAREAAAEAIDPNGPVAPRYARRPAAGAPRTEDHIGYRPPVLSPGPRLGL